MALKSKALADVRPTVPIAEVTKEDLVRINLNVPESVRTKWKKAALDRKISLAELIVSAVETNLSK